MMAGNVSEQLILFVNGVKVIRRDPNPRMMLSEFLREDLKLKGTKVACGEGGCGSCTVLVSKFDRRSSHIIHCSVNACVTPVCCLHGLAVTTIEALGSTRAMLHPLQERLVKGHGVQCGFCSPGMIMSMYALLRNNPQPSELQIENAIKGNLCRCTGYRPILDAFKTFAKDVCPMGEQCCQKTGKQIDTIDCVETDCRQVHNETQELIFPNELQLSGALDQMSLAFGSDADVLWYRPVTLSELLKLRQRYPQSRLAAGCTALSFVLKSFTTSPLIVIATSHVPELSGVLRSETSIFVGANTTVSQLEDVLAEAVSSIPESKSRLATALLDMLKVFGSTQIRNMATVGGSLALASSASDINIVLLTSNCKVHLASEGAQREIPIGEFIRGKGITAMCLDEIITGLTLPFSNEDEFYGSFKQSVRKDLTMADVNAAMYLHFDTGTTIVKCARLAVGGTLMSSATLIDVNQYFVGRKWDADILETALPGILAQFHDDTCVSDGHRYKLASIHGFLFRFYLLVNGYLSQKLGLAEVSESDHLFLEASEKRNMQSHSGLQVYHISESESEAGAVGQPLEHMWAKQCVTGEAVFVDDVRPAHDELYLALATSTKACARVVNVDPSVALAVPGVIGYINHKDVPGPNATGFYKTEELFATEQVNWVGQTIGAVVANSHETARRAARLVQVQYNESKPVLTIEDAIAQNSFHHFPPGMGQLDRGDTNTAFKSADHVIEGEVRIGGQEHFYMETHCARVVPTGEDGEMDVYVGTQNASRMQGHIASALNVLSNKITVHVKRMGGAFGGKEFRSVLVILPVAVAAKKFNRPVRCMLDRQQDMQMTGVRRPYVAKYKVGFSNDGKIQALDIVMYSNEGYMPEVGSAFMAQSVLFMDNCYSIPNMSVRSFLCKTNLPPNAAMRGAGAPQGLFICEYWMRQVASFLKVPAVKVQQLNMYKAGDLTISNIPIEASLSRCFLDVLKQSNYEDEARTIAEFNKKSQHVKRGIDIIPIRFGPGMPPDWMQATALAHIYVDGSVLLAHGGVESGQGLHTKMIQVASQVLGIPVELIHTSETSTNFTPNATTTGGSSGSDVNGPAVMNACHILLERLKPYRDVDPSASWQQIVTAAYADRVNLSASGYFKCPSSEDYNWVSNKGKFSRYLTYGAGVVQVEIDCLSGNYTILKVDIVMDVGKSLNPAIDVGQIEGGFVMGIGYHALEDHRYGSDGRLQTSGSGRYHIPSVSSIPLEMNVTLLKDSSNPEPQAVYSSKGIGEPPLLLSAAVFFAIRDAVSAARSELGLPAQFTINSPATVSQILLACTKI